MASFVTPQSTATTGQAVLFELSWSDGDAMLIYDGFSVFDADDPEIGTLCSSVRRYGPWTLMATPESGTLRYTHTFVGPGTYRVVVLLAAGSTYHDCRDWNYSETSVETTVTVTDPDRP